LVVCVLIGEVYTLSTLCQTQSSQIGKNFGKYFRTNKMQHYAQRVTVRAR
jgi:hypothetical protein